MSAGRALLTLGGAWLLGACSQTAGAGAARSGVRLGAAELQPSAGQPATDAPRASGAPALELFDRHDAFVFNRGAAEIVDYHAPSSRVFVVDSGAARVRVLELGPSGFRSGERALEPERDLARGEGERGRFRARAVTSLAVAGDRVAVAVPAARGDRRGRVAFYSAASLDYQGSVVVGFGPDMLTFTPDGRTLLVANEGEQVRDAEQRIAMDPEGSVSVIDVSGGVQQARVSHARFERFDAAVAAYRAAGVRSPRLPDRFFESGDGEVRLSRDLEPEYIAVAPDGASAWVTLQENDAVARLDIASASFVELLPLGVKDFSRGQPRLERVTLAPSGGLTLAGAGTKRADPSGLWFEPGEGRAGQAVMYVSRGAALERHVLEGERATWAGTIPLDPRLRGDERHLRGLARDPRDGVFWLGDATRPVLYRVAPDGRLLDELALPGAGVAALALDPDARRVLAFLAPSAAAPGWAHVLVLDADPGRPSFGEPLAEHLYPLGVAPGQAPTRPVAAALVDGDRLLVVERSEDGTELLYRADLRGAGDLRALEPGPGLAPATLEALLASHALAPIHRRFALGLSNPGHSNPGHFAGAGLAALPGGRLGVLGGPALQLLPGRADPDADASAVVLGIVSFDAWPGLDASDRDGAAQVSRWPLLGEYMPDGIAALRLGGSEYFVTANEGDTRGYDVARLRDLTLDPARFPDAAALQASQSLGRLKVSALDGDLDGDGDLDDIVVFGTRSLSLWDRFGRLVYDTGSLFDQVTLTALGGAFNSNNDANGSFDTRSDDRGPEPEGLTVAEIDGRTYAFVGLERVGGIVVLDVTDPASVRFVEYDNPRDFAGDVARGAARDLGPEGLKFVPAHSSPTGRALLLVANEVSGTTTAYHVNL